MATSVWDTAGMVGASSGRDFGKHPASFIDYEYAYQVVNKVMPLANWELHPDYSQWSGPSSSVDAYYVSVPGRYDYDRETGATNLTWDNWSGTGVFTQSYGGAPTNPSIHGTQYWRFIDSHSIKIILAFDYLDTQWLYYTGRSGSSTVLYGKGMGIRIRPFIESNGVSTEYKNAINMDEKPETFWPLFDPMACDRLHPRKTANDNYQAPGHISYSDDHCFVTMPNISPDTVVPGFFVGRGVKTDGTVEPHRIILGAQRGRQYAYGYSTSYPTQTHNYGVQNFHMYAIDHVSRRMAYSPSHPLMITEQGPHKSDMVIYPTIPLFPGTLDEGSTTPWFVNGWARDMTLGSEFTLTMNGATRNYKTVSVGGSYHGQYNGFIGGSHFSPDPAGQIHFAPHITETNSAYFKVAQDPYIMATAVLWE